MHYYRFFLNTACVTIILLFVAGCSSSSNNDSPVRTKLNIQASLPKDGSTASGQPIFSFKTKGELGAYIRLDGGQFRKMKIEADRAAFSIDNLQPGTYSIDIEFRYQTEEYDSVTLVAATQSITISEGGTSLTFDEESYQYLDDDNDKASNYNELRFGTNPRDEDKIAPETIAFPAGGDSGGYWGPQTVILSCTDLGASGCDKTYYTTDGSEPKENLNRIEYDTGILIEKNTTLKFYSIDKVGNEETTTKLAQYIIGEDNAPPTTILTPPPETYQGLIRIQVECTDTGGSRCSFMYYTTNGSNPKTSQNRSKLTYPTKIKVADTKIIITDTTTLKFYSVDNAGNEEETREVEYKIVPTLGAALSRSIRTPERPYIAAETYYANMRDDIASFSSLHPSGDFAYRIKNNKILGFRLKPATLTPILELAVQGIATSIAIHPSGKFAYIASSDKNSSKVTAYEVNQETGAWNKIATPISNLPIHAKVITITPRGNFLYLLSDQNIMTYNIAPETGRITESLNQHTVLTATPNAALFSQSGEQLYIRYQTLDMMEKYTIDIQTGALDGPIKQLPVNGTITPKTMLILGQSFYLIDTDYPLFTKTVDNYVETFW